MHIWIGLALALIVNFGLFGLMHSMSSPDNIQRQKAEPVELIEFVRVQRETQSEPKQRQLPKKPPTPNKPPPPPATPQPSVNQPTPPTPQVSVPQISVPLNIAGQPYLGAVAEAAPAPSTPAVVPAVQTSGMDNEVVPLVRVPPRYPRKAARRNIEGVVTVSFTITKDGRVKNPTVIKATPPDIFNKEALKAILKWSFKPKLENGQPVERMATQEIEFKLQ